MNLVRMKRSTTIQGIIMSPLTVGRKAIIFHKGRLIRTQRVVAVHGVSDDEIRFETEDANYTLFGSPHPESGYALHQTALAA